MMSQDFEHLKQHLRATPETWLVTGAAGFIGSHLVENLLALNQTVTGLDNLSTGHEANLQDVQTRVSQEQWARFRFIRGDITNLADCQRACDGVTRVLHQAALGSVPRSLAFPLQSHASNVDGFINVLEAVRAAGAKRFVYASSSSVYGDHPDLPKVESKVGRVLSPYAATKAINEVYAGVYHRSFGLPVIGLRYFNVFGPRQDPNGAYAAVIPRWFAAAFHEVGSEINGDGETSRDFCYIANVVQANLLAAMTPQVDAVGRVYNVAFGARTTLNELHARIRECASQQKPEIKTFPPKYQPERPGDVRHSLADIGQARTFLHYSPSHDIEAGLKDSARWYAHAARPGQYGA